MNTTDIVDVKVALTESLTELHLPTVKRVYEEAARFGERETLSYERYLLDLVTRESQDRKQKRIQRLLAPIAYSGRESLSQLQPEAAAAERGTLNQVADRGRRAGSA
jgi:hypothetical protein